MTDLVSLQDAADEIGWTVEELFNELVRSGMVLKDPEGGYQVSPHPDIGRMAV